MAKQNEAIESQVQAEVAKFAGNLVKIVQRGMLAEFSRVAGMATQAAGTSKADAAPTKTRQKRRKILCPVENCGKPGGGPKWGWFCETHKDLSPEIKAQIRAATKAAKKEATAATEVTTPATQQ